MFEDKVKELLEEALSQRDDLFLIEMSIGGDNGINVIIDGDTGVSVEDCMFVSRAIEHNLDREEQDFSLEVASVGATAPLTQSRQYKKHVGRTLNVKTSNEEIEGKLANVSDEDIQLEWKAREPKPVGKGKVTVQKQAQVAYKDIVEAKVMIKF